MSSLLSAELAATCNALGYFDPNTNKYHADSNTLETAKDLIRYLRRDNATHDIRRQLGETKVLQVDLLPLLKSYWEESDLFDVLLRLLVNLTTPALMLWNEEPPTHNKIRKFYLEIEDHLKSYKEAFADEKVWAILSTRLSKILEIDYAERGDENSLIIERILILIRNILYVPPDPTAERRPDNDASLHDQVLWALQQSGAFDIILFITSSVQERAYYMHALEILSFMLREQNASDLARAAVQRSEMEKSRDGAELLAIKHRETNQRKEKMRMYSGARHSRFGGTYVIKSMKSISDNELIYHKPLNKLDALNFDTDKKKVKISRRYQPIHTTTYERRSAFSVRLFLKEFCVEFLNGAYNTLMFHVKDGLVRARAQAHDESYYLWALKFFMEFNRCYKFEVKLVSETMSLQSFHYVQQLLENYYDLIRTNKKKFMVWSSRLHIALLAYKELFLTLCMMDRSADGAVKESSRIIKSNIFYLPEYRELVVVLMVNYDETKMSDAYLRDLMDTQNIFLRIFQTFCSDGSVMVQTKSRANTKGKRKSGAQRQIESAGRNNDLNLDALWEEISPQLSVALEGNVEVTEKIVPFDAASDIPIDDQKSEAMKNIQKKLRDGDYENAIALLRASREVWPENDCFGSANMAPEEEFLALQEIFHADIGGNERNQAATYQEQPIYDENDEEEGDEDGPRYAECDIKFEDFTKRLCNPKIVRACGLALRNFESNPVSTNHAIIKLLHRIAFDCKMYVMVFQVSIFRTFQRIFKNKAMPENKELVKFATYIIRQFIKVAGVNEKVYLEALFWKTKSEAYDIEHGYGTYTQQSQASLKAWSETEEDELRRLFMEHRENQLDQDVADWIVDNLIDNTRTRRAVIKKLKELCLLTDGYKKNSKSAGGAGNGPRANSKAPRQWGAQEETQLRELFEQFKDAVADPVDCVMEALEVKRSRRKIVEKLLVMGLIHDKREVAKKRTKKSKPNEKNPDSGSDVSSGSESDNEENAISTREKNQNKKPKRGAFSQVSVGKVAKLLVNLVTSGMNDALEWVKDSFSDAIEDYDCENEGIPLVPIMDYAVDAMDNPDFQQTLKALGVTQPFDEQETYWRIPGDMPLQVLKTTCELLQQALDNTLSVPEESQIENEIITSDNPETQSSRDSIGISSSKKSKKRKVVIESDDENDSDQENDPQNAMVDDKSGNESDDSLPPVNLKKRSIVIESDHENGIDDQETSIPKLQSRTVIDEDNVGNESDDSLPPVNLKKKSIAVLVESDDEESISNLKAPQEIIDNLNANSVNVVESEDGNESGGSLPAANLSKRKIFVDNGSKNSEDNKRTFEDSDGSDVEKPTAKRGKFNLSSEDEN